MGTAQPRAVDPNEAGRAGEAIGSLYVHAPFCSRRCFYCDFAVKVAPGGDPTEWLAALAAELDSIEREGRFLLDDVLDTVYVGGGTPSLLGPEAMGGLREILGHDRLRSADLEWTCEANPESFGRDVADAWRRAGVNRISLGTQSFHEPSLRWMGRLHGPAGAIEAVQTARAVGFENLSLDLIFGLPDHLERDLSSDLDRLLELEVDHVSLYGLTVESGTPLGRSVAEGREQVAPDERYEAEYLMACERLTEAGFEAYEVSNFARAGRASRHNSAYWSGDPYLGLGNGAHSYQHPIRRWNLRDWDAYRIGAEGAEPPLADQEEIDSDMLRLERIWLGLRTSRGLTIATLPARARERVGRWVEAGLAREDDDVVRLTPKGWLIMDRLTVELDRDLSPVD